METESLSTYENNRNADIMEGNVDSGDFDSSVDADILPQDKDEDSKSGDKDIIDCDEQTCTTSKELNSETEPKKDFTTFDSDVEEEEEDIPLNITADKSDEDSDVDDENLEESDRDETENAEKDKSSENGDGDDTEQVQNTALDDKSARVEDNNANESEKVSNETVSVSDDETADPEKFKAGPSHTEACGEASACGESGEASGDIVKNSDDLKLDNETILLSDDDTDESEKSRKGASEQAENISDKPESVSNNDNDDHSNQSEKNENDEKEGDVDKSESGKDGDDKSEKKVAETILPTEDEAVSPNISEKGTNDDSDKGSNHESSEEPKQSTEKTDNPPEENVQSPKNDSKSDESKTSTSELQDQPVTNDNNDTKTTENEITTVTDSNDKKDEKALDNGKKSEVVEIMDLSDDEDNKPKSVQPLKRKRKRVTAQNQNTSKSKRTDPVERDPLEINPDEELPKNLSGDMADEDMDEDFDMSLFCPDINMEIDEAPVITNSDAPPSSADGSKSPALIDPLFSTYVDEVTGAEVEFNLTPEEEALRRETFGEKNPVKFTRIHCTACNMHLGSALDGQANRFVHPLLKVLICKNCYHFYTSGEFEKDEDGSELYCRWCGQGGQVMCCSNCEMVFCKKCIRINFDRKKMAEIRDREDWVCFRCNPSQLIPQRIHCAEFIEYVRTETIRASTLENSSQFMTIDHSRCCTSAKRKPTDALPGEVKKRRRRAKEDPDYDPIVDRSCSPVPSTSGVVAPKVVPKLTLPKNPPRLVPIVPKPMEGNKVTSPNTPFKIGSTTFRPQIIGNIRPRGPYVASVSNQVPGQNSPRQMFKLIPNLNLTRVPAPRVGIAAVRQPTPSTSTGPAQTHEWFDKTVVATARVNSNLSYTLSQLNQSQAKAKTVQALAVVHNKLQEILSNSINSLIQIRKNLRVEFIAGVCTENPAPIVPPSTSRPGIRNTRFPAQGGPPSLLPKPPTPSTPAAATSSAQDDDVILVTSPTEPTPPPKKQIPIKLPSSVSLIKKTPNKIAPDKETPVPSSTITPFLRVKPLTSLQAIPSELITIPDDDVKPPPPLAKVQNRQKLVVKKDSLFKALLVNGTGKTQKEEKVEGVKTSTVVNNHTETQEKKSSRIDLKKPLSQDVKKMMEVKVIVPKLSIMEKKIRNEFKTQASESKNDKNK